MLASLAGCTLAWYSYPTGYSKDQKRSLIPRQIKAKLNFRVKSGVFYYSASSVSAEERRWRSRRVITIGERHRVISCMSCIS